MIDKLREYDPKYAAITVGFTLAHIIALPLTVVVCAQLGISTTKVVQKCLGGIGFLA